MDTPRKRPRTPKEDKDFLRPHWMTCFEILDSLGGRRCTSPLKLPHPWLSLYMMLKLDGEVVNGGFHQFFWNSEGKYDQATDEALAYFGATEFREIFKRAIACAKEYRVVETKRRSENTWEDFTAGYKTIPWDALDEAYYQASPTLFQNVARHLREHPNEFNRKT
jgi:hypothetical protein